jgi:hypothetical protein
VGDRAWRRLARRDGEIVLWVGGGRLAIGEVAPPELARRVGESARLGELLCCRVAVARGRGGWR